MSKSDKAFILLMVGAIVAFMFYEYRRSVQTHAAGIAPIPDANTPLGEAIVGSTETHPAMLTAPPLMAFAPIIAKG